MNYTQKELYDSIQQYVQQYDEHLSSAMKAVVQWKYAECEMFGMVPLFHEIGFRGDNQWRPAARSWLSEKPVNNCYEHGIDQSGRIRIIKCGKLTTLFFYSDQVVDEMPFRDREPAPRGLRRYITQDGRVQAIYDCCISPEQYSLEKFQYRDGHPIRSDQQSWYVSDDQWVQASWTTTCTYEYDAAGLARVYRDMGERLGGKKLVYVRPGIGRLRHRTRRPFVAYVIDPGSDRGEASHVVYSDAYGLEMNIDDEWPVDTVLLAPPRYVKVITGDTGVTSMGTVYAGASSMDSICDVRTAKKASARWILVDANHASAKSRVASVLKAKLNVILTITKPSELSSVLTAGPGLSSDRLVVAMNAKADSQPASIQALAAQARQLLKSINCADSRLIVAAQIGKETIVDFLSQPDIDGVLHREGDFSSALDVLVPLALES
ncbi:MAG: hypothetical protein IT423_01095 [Pirellulaceae bacterium]|nr:hypothetical protein [Pirellulaceae bacterium]